MEILNVALLKGEEIDEYHKFLRSNHITEGTFLPDLKFITKVYDKLYGKIVVGRIEGKIVSSALCIVIPIKRTTPSDTHLIRDITQKEFCSSTSELVGLTTFILTDSRYRHKGYMRKVLEYLIQYGVEIGIEKGIHHTSHPNSSIMKEVSECKESIVYMSKSGHQELVVSNSNIPYLFNCISPTYAIRFSEVFTSIKNDDSIIWGYHAKIDKQTLYILVYSEGTIKSLEKLLYDISFCDIPVVTVNSSFSTISFDLLRYKIIGKRFHQAFSMKENPQELLDSYIGLCI